MPTPFRRPHSKWYEHYYVGTFGADTPYDAFDVGWDAFEVRIAEIRQRTEDRNRAVVQTRIASLDKRHRSEIRRLEDRLDNAERLEQAESIIRLHRGQIRNTMQRYDTRRSELEGEMNVPHGTNSSRRRIGQNR